MFTMQYTEVGCMS